MEQYLASLQVVKEDEHPLLAVSGGRDSMVMLDLFDSWRRKRDRPCTVAHINHQLRGSESDEDEEFVHRVARGKGIPFISRRITIGGKGERKGLSVQAAARDLRYAALEDLRIASGATSIMTAHHADDNAETLLDHFIRGSGVRGLRGIPPVSGRIIRPLLFAGVDELTRYAAENSLDWREDSSNAGDAYRRNVIRHHLMPMIREKLNPSFEKTGMQLSEIFRCLQEYLDVRINPLFEESSETDSEFLSLAIPALKNYLDFEKIAVIQRAIEVFYHHTASNSDVASILPLITSPVGKAAVIRGNECVYRDRERLVLTRGSKPPFLDIEFSTGDIAYYSNNVLTIVPVNDSEVRLSADPTREFIDQSKVGRRWILRHWRPADVFHPLGAPGMQKVSDFLINGKIPRYRKDEVLVLENFNETYDLTSTGGKIVWICGYRLDDRFKIGPSTASILKLEITGGEHE